MNKHFYSLLFFLFSICCFQTTYAQPGRLDSSFGKKGTTVSDLGGYDDYAAGLAVLPDGKIIQGGSTVGLGTGVYCAVKYKQAGSVDSSFGNNGKSQVSFGSNSAALAKAVLMQPDGKFVVAGTVQLGVANCFGLVRFNADGSPDASFGSNGKVLTPLSKLLVSQTNALALQPDGKIIAAGYTVSNRARVKIVVIRYNANGTVDSSFGTNGKVIPVFPGDANALTARVTPAGKILVGGFSIQADNNVAGLIIRLNADGNFDSSFADKGQLLLKTNSATVSITDIALLNNGRLLAGSEIVYVNTLVRNFGLTRINSNGSIDKSFGDNGIVKTNVNSQEGIASLALQPDGKIVAGGAFSSLARYNADGNLDKSFGASGIVRFRPDSLGASIPYLIKIALQNNDKLITGGFIYNSSSATDFFVKRYLLADAASLATDNRTLPVALQFGIVPNPAVAYIRLVSKEDIKGNVLVSISNTNGTVLQQNKLGGLNDNINISRLQKGMYQVKIAADGRQGVCTLIKE